MMAYGTMEIESSGLAKPATSNGCLGAHQP
jgi:hypothetical protein